MGLGRRHGRMCGLGRHGTPLSMRQPTPGHGSAQASIPRPGRAAAAAEGGRGPIARLTAPKRRLRVGSRAARERTMPGQAARSSRPNFAFFHEIRVRWAAADFHDAAEFDDELSLAVRLARIGRTSFVFEIGVFRGEQLLTDITLTYVNATPEGRTPAPVPQAFIDRVLAFEPVPPARK